ncbi:MAG: type III-B CRISPR module RAMP protein Cmr4 [Candidatus Electrothrix sp. AR4]|nr:type III-B CRISPR module RAMP protein Cmr4 [Candidatus Electrothrix sp. AR4]
MSQPVVHIITLQALTFLHPGTGQSTGVVDLPVQREVYSGHPMYAASGFKGSLRDKAEQTDFDQKIVTTLFGKDKEEENRKKKLSEEEKNELHDSVAGALAVTDGRILAFPVRSLQKVFVWVTCPMVLNRLLRDAKLIRRPINSLQKIASGPKGDHAWAIGFSSPLVLEELTFECEENGQRKQAADLVKDLIGGATTGFDPDKLVIVPDEDFTYLVQHATQVSARIKLNKQKKTSDNLWYEETLPPETILYGFALCHKPRNETSGIKGAVGIAEQLKALCADHYLQIGGNETVGQGWCHVNIFPGE